MFEANVHLIINQSPSQVPSILCDLWCIIQMT